MEVDFRNVPRRMELARKQLDEAKMLEGNKTLLKQYLEFKQASGIKQSTILKNIFNLIVFSREVSKPFQEVTAQDLQKAVLHFEGQAWSPHTKSDLKSTIKGFWKWLKQSEGYPPEVSWIRTNKPKRRFIARESILTREDVQKLVDACGSLEERAFISGLYESGARISEFLSLKLKDVWWEGQFLFFRVDGKTGQRIIPIGDVQVKALMKNYLELEHAGKSQEAQLWRFKNYNTVLWWFHNLFIQAGLKNVKACNPHSLRHARATELANQLSEAQMKAFFGWTQSSRMPDVYVHTGLKDLVQEFNKIYPSQVDENKANQLAVKITAACLDYAPFRKSFAEAIKILHLQNDYREFLSLGLGEQKTSNLSAGVAYPTKKSKKKAPTKKRR